MPVAEKLHAESVLANKAFAQTFNELYSAALVKLRKATGEEVYRAQGELAALDKLQARLRGAATRAMSPPTDPGLRKPQPFLV